MNDYLIGLALNAALGTALAALYMWRYRVKVVTPQRLQQFQYRLFAIRDRMVRLVAEGVMDEEDPRFEFWYKTVNRSATPAAVDRIRGAKFVFRLLRCSKPPSEEEIDAVRSMPTPAVKVLVDYVNTLLGICWEGSLLLRAVIGTARSFQLLKNLVGKFRPAEMRRYVDWRDVGQRLRRFTQPTQFA